jgi:hypothetical protein
MRALDLFLIRIEGDAVPTVVTPYPKDLLADFLMSVCSSNHLTTPPFSGFATFNTRHCHLI